MKDLKSKPIDNALIDKVEFMSPNYEKSTFGKDFLEESKQHPCLFMMIRRSACPVCLYQVNELNEKAKELKELGFKLYLIPQERIKVDELVERFPEWNVWIDPNMGFHKALGRGEFIKASYTRMFSLDYIKYFMKVRKAGYKAPKNPNLVMGAILGGILILKDGKVVYDFPQQLFDDSVDPNVLLNECCKIMGKPEIAPEAAKPVEETAKKEDKAEEVVDKNEDKVTDAADKAKEQVKEKVEQAAA